MNIVALVFISCFVMGPCNGDESIATPTVRDKRYDGLMRELVDLLSEQKSERKILLKRCAYVENMIKKLTTGLRTTKRSVKHLEKTTTRQHSNTLKRCEDIEGEVKKLNSAIGTTKQSLKRLGETKTRQHSNTQKQINGIVGTVKDLNTRTKQQLTKIESDINAINNTRGIKNRIAFSVKLNTDPFGRISFKNDAVVTFSKIISNFGNGYNVATGKFTCKIPGLYFFTVTAISATNHGATWIMTSIKNKNTKIIEALAAYEVPKNKSRDRYVSGTASTVLRLGVGDEVFVKPDSLSGKVIYEWNSSFSGMLISK